MRVMLFDAFNWLYTGIIENTRLISANQVKRDISSLWLKCPRCHYLKIPDMKSSFGATTANSGVHRRG